MKRISTLAALAVAALAAGSSPAAAATTTVEVNENDVVVIPWGEAPASSGWYLMSREGGVGSFVAGPASAPLGNGSFETRTPADNDKVQLFNADHRGTPLASIDVLSYSTFRNPGSTAPAGQLPSINITAAVGGVFTTLVYEPIYSPAQGAVVSGSWQNWDAHQGKWWSTRAIPGVCARDCFVPWGELVSANPTAQMIDVGVNQGGGNPGLVGAADALALGIAGDTTVWDFEPVLAPTPQTKDQCKAGGWKGFQAPRFANQGDCVSFVATGGRNPGKG